MSDWDTISEASRGFSANPVDSMAGRWCRLKNVQRVHICGWGWVGLTTFIRMIRIWGSTGFLERNVYVVCPLHLYSVIAMVGSGWPGCPGNWNLGKRWVELDNTCQDSKGGHWPTICRRIKPVQFVHKRIDASGEDQSLSYHLSVAGRCTSTVQDELKQLTAGDAMTRPWAYSLLTFVP